MRFLRITVILAILVVLSAGCEIGTSDTGEKTYRLDPNVAGQLDKGAEGGLTMLEALSIFWPALVPVVTAAAGGVSVYRKMYPKIIKAQTKEQHAYNAGSVLAQLIEVLKRDYPETWSKCKGDFKTAIGVGTVVEETIRGFRGLKKAET